MREINGKRLRMHLKGNSGITEKMHEIAMYLALRIRDVKLLTVFSLITSSFFLWARSGFPAYICEVVSLSSCRRHCKDFVAVCSLSVQLLTATSAFQLNAAARWLFFR